MKKFSILLFASFSMLFSSGQCAHGAIEAYSFIDISDFGVYKNAGGGSLGSLVTGSASGVGVDLQVVSFSFTSNASSDIASIPGSASTNTSGPVTFTPAGLDTLQAFEGVGLGPGENSFGNFVGATPFARGDTTGAGAIIGGLGFSTPASASAVSEAELSTSNAFDTGSADSDVTSTASFVVQIGSSPLSAVFDLLIARSLLADLIPSPPGFSASADTSFNITITQVGAGTVFNWSPDGAAGGITGGTEYLDPFDTGESVSGFPGFTNPLVNPAARFRAGTTLSAGNRYSITIKTQTNADVSKVPVVPEASSLAIWMVVVFVVGGSGMYTSMRHRVEA